MGEIYNLGRVKGLSAYEVAVNNGFIGTEKEWLESLKSNSTDANSSSAIVLPFGMDNKNKLAVLKSGYYQLHMRGDERDYYVFNAASENDAIGTTDIIDVKSTSEIKSLLLVINEKYYEETDYLAITYFNNEDRVLGCESSSVYIKELKKEHIGEYYYIHVESILQKSEHFTGISLTYGHYWEETPPQYQYDILKSKPYIMINDKYSLLENNLSGFRFGVNVNGEYGYYKLNSDEFVPFGIGVEKTPTKTVSYSSRKTFDINDNQNSTVNVTVVKE